MENSVEITTLIQMVDELTIKLHHHTPTSHDARCRMMKNLLIYCTAHFQAEEASMRACCFPGAEAHEIEHDAIQQKLSNNFHSLIDASDEALVVFIRDVFIQHIALWDEAFGAWQASQG